jgi:Uma2 family endonuclease
MQFVAEKKADSGNSVPRAGNNSSGVPKPLRWTVDQFYRMNDLGFFRGKRVELIRGEIIEIAPMKTPHATTVRLLVEVFRAVFGRGYLVDSQLPLRLGKTNEPEPDVAVIKGNVRQFSKSHPNFALLVVEVADSSINYDKGEKAVLYAEYAITEYWVVNLKERQVEVHRKPSGDAAQGYYFAEQMIYREGETLSPLARPRAKIKVSDVLP